VYLDLDAIALKVRSAGKVTGLPVLAVIAALADGTKRLVSLEVCGSESGDAWEGFLQGLIGRGLKAPRLCMIDGNAGLHGAIAMESAGGAR
jgi:transposase-like protein